MVTKSAAPSAHQRSRHDRVAHLTPDQRVARGRAARTAVPRASHAGFEPHASRRDPISILQDQAAARVPELVPVRYGRMAASPFAFYRGAAAVMAADLASTPRSGLTVQACGDAHLVNFGIYFSPERQLVFDINDFDETLPGPWEWDVKRLAASVVVAARANGFSRSDRADAVRETMVGYRTAMSEFAAMPNLDVWYARLDLSSIIQALEPHIDAKRRKFLRGVQTKAQSRDNLQALSKLTTVVDGEPRFVSMPPLIVPIEELAEGQESEKLEEALRAWLRGYRVTLSDDRRHLVEEYELQHVARKVVGVGSVGTRAWVALLRGRDSDDPLLLQIKQALPSVLEPYVGRSAYDNAGRRVVAGQRLMQAASDIFLGWHRAQGIDGLSRDFYVRQLRDGKGGFDPTILKPEGLGLYGRTCGWTLARAHARSGDSIAIAAYVGTGNSFDRAVLAFAEAYADQNERDHAALVAAIADGRVPAVEGV